MADFTQAERFLAISSSPLKDDALVLRGFHGDEAISKPYHFTLDLIAAAKTDMTKVVGKPVSISAKLPDDKLRYFHGKVLRIAAGEVHSDEYADSADPLRSYRAEIVPWFSFLKFHADNRVFQEKTIPEIVEQVCKDRGMTDYKLSLKGTYAKLDYCVQYNETDYNFVSRLMEKAGIFYYFNHEDTKHTLVMGDAASSYVDCVENEVEFGDRFDDQAAGQIQRWEQQLEFFSGNYVQRDYNFETPTETLETKEKTKVKWAGVKDFESYEYPGGYAKAADGKPLTVGRIEVAEAPAQLVIGRGSCLSFSPGGKFKLASHPVESEIGIKHVLTSVSHKAIEPTLVLQTRDSDESKEPQPEYVNEFQCAPANVPFRPPRDTPLPRIYGLHPAKVVGAKNQEILTDKYGRIKIQFPWDREGKYDDKSSCWVRVAQTWAGAKRGALFIPRVGDEVLVDFINGDVDRPLVVGSVYNADNMPPYALPEDKYKSGIKTMSTDKAKAKNFNELRFEDKIGKELVYFHAERDFERVVENDDKLKIGFDAKDPGDQTIDIFNNRTVTVDKGTDVLQIKAGDRKFTVDKGNHAVTIKQGDQTVKISAGQQTVEAAKKITLKVGGSSIVMTPDGIKITSMNVKIKGSIGAEVKGGVSAKLVAGAIAEVKGGLVKIN